MADKIGGEITLDSPKTQGDIKRALTALESIAASLHTLANGPGRAGTPTGDPGVLKLLTRIADALEGKAK